VPIDDAEHAPAPTVPAETTEAITLLYRREGGAVYRTIYGIVLDASEARNLTRDAFARAYRDRDRFDGAGPRAWLLGIAAHLAIAHERGSQRRHGVARWTPSEAVDLDEPETQSGDADLVAWLLRPLTPEQRALVTLCYYQHLPPAELANLLGISAVTVSSRLNRAMEVLRRRAQTAGTSQVGGAREFAAR
jgi:RNA polymerase sigma-70 factor (ECF subfamily)